MGESALSKTGRILIAIRDYYYVAISAFREDTDEKGIITCILYLRQSDQIQVYDLMCSAIAERITLENISR